MSWFLMLGNIFYTYNCNVTDIICSVTMNVCVLFDLSTCISSDKIRYMYEFFRPWRQGSFENCSLCNVLLTAQLSQLHVHRHREHLEGLYVGLFSGLCSFSSITHNSEKIFRCCKQSRKVKYTSSLHIAQ